MGEGGGSGFKMDSQGSAPEVKKKKKKTTAQPLPRVSD